MNSSGTDVDHIVYDPYGNIVTETNASNGDRFEFAGMQYDTATGIYYDHARFYDPAIGRFISQDPKGFKAGDTNLYRYSKNSPTVDVDPSGDDPITLILLGGFCIAYFCMAGCGGNPPPPARPAPGGGMCRPSGVTRLILIIYRL